MIKRDSVNLRRWGLAVGMFILAMCLGCALKSQKTTNEQGVSVQQPAVAAQPATEAAQSHD